MERRKSCRTVEERNRLVEANLGLVRAIAAKMIRLGKKARLTLDEMVSAGVLGLIRAAEIYDETKGAKFSVIAYKNIRWRILGEMERQSLVAVPREFLYDKESRGRWLASDPGFDGKLAAAKAPAASLAILTETQLGISAPARESFDCDIAAVLGAIRVLPDRERELVQEYYLKGKTHRSIAKRLGCCRENVRVKLLGCIKLLRQKFGVEQEVSRSPKTSGNFQANVRRLRLSKGLSQAVLGEILGLSRLTIGLWENGRVQPHPDNLAALAKALGVHPDELCA